MDSLTQKNHPSKSVSRLSRRKRIAFSLLALLLSLSFMVVVGEIACRALQGDRYSNITLDYAPPGSVVYDPEIGWRYRPGYHGIWKYFEYEFAVEIDALGLRDSEFDSHSNPSMLFLGDSFTFGVGVEREKTFVELLEATNSDHSLKYNCINASRIGAGSDVYLKFARELIPIVQPEHIIVCVYTENDYDDVRAFRSGDLENFTERDGRVYYKERPLDEATQVKTGPVPS